MNRYIHVSTESGTKLSCCPGISVMESLPFNGIHTSLGLSLVDSTGLLHPREGYCFQ